MYPNLVYEWGPASYVQSLQPHKILPDMSMFSKILSPRKAAVTLSLLIVVWIIWTFSSDDHHEKWYYREAPCKTPEHVMEDMIELAFRMHEILDKLRVPHFLCYGTLWGAVRMESLLPWDNNIDFCVLDEDISKVDEAFLYTSFQHSNLMISYNARHGVYNIKYKQAVGALTVFQKFFDQMQHAGWEVRLLPFMYTNLDEFPQRLVAKPFPTQKFLGSNFPVPQEGVELLKYLYPDDWWKEIKPKGC